MILFWRIILYSCTGVIAISSVATLYCIITKRRAWRKWLLTAILSIILLIVLLLLVLPKTNIGSDMAPEVGKTQFDKGLYDAAIVTLSLIGKNASQYSEAQRLIAMANSRIADNYKSSCKTMEYRVMEKNPDALAGMRVKLHGKIFYIREDSNSTFLLLLITYSDYGYGDWNDSVAVFFNGSFGAYRDDIITVWGEIKGAYTYESTAGYNVTVPSVNGEYVQYPKH